MSKEPREFWIERDTIGNEEVYVHDDPRNKLVSGPREVIHVREVTETCEITDKSVEEMANTYAFGTDEMGRAHIHGEKKKAFKAGHASRQPEIDTLTAKVKRYEEAMEFAKMTIEHAIALGYLGEGSTRGMANDAISQIEAAIRESKKNEEKNRL